MFLEKEFHFATLSDETKGNGKKQRSCQYSNIRDFQMNKVIQLSQKLFCRLNSRKTSLMK